MKCVLAVTGLIDVKKTKRPLKVALGDGDGQLTPHPYYTDHHWGKQLRWSSSPTDPNDISKPATD